ncbi:subclass B3 metallo-beta-lactamase [Chitinophaga sp. Cy-1792]|uniref:subclass B3 metallo-beta-lactamase n=1 Tax=Chitinophaga sp. Cy-1792 TaxID=2608339 RepID=UPI00141F4B1D|nr:subclass B3 metallo-beta-lactamase [Chitinophaga sp. Cy-1792]NIG56833.1 subclass B3 metallo-beta-lactamase [Chitinophaga sp. Cy-1792]
MHHKIVKSLFLAAGLCFATAVHAQKVVEPTKVDPEWNKPQKPFRIAGNLYYVGTYDLTSYLITTSAGNILINTGLAASEKIIRENIEALGFKYKDTKILLTMQAHYDHMGAMAAIKKATGAQFMVDAGDVGVVETGGRSDYEMGGKVSNYQPVKIDRVLHDKDTIRLGDMKVVMLHHPGHTMGSCSYIFDVKDDQRSYKVLLANMPSIIIGQRKFSEVKAYPGIAKDYAYTLDTMPKIHFDIWLAGHASQCGLHEKHKDGDAYNPKAFEDRAGYEKQLAELKAVYEKKLAEDKK